MNPKNVTIIGAGLTGSLLALYLAKRNYSVQVYERRMDPRVKKDRTPSIDLAISTRGIYALRELGLEEKVLKVAVPIYGQYIYSEKNTQKVLQNFIENNSQKVYSISRFHLNNILLDALHEFPNVTLNFGHRLLEINLDENQLAIQNEKADFIFDDKFSLLIACDGTTSPTRECLVALDIIKRKQIYLKHGFKELVLKPKVPENLPKNYFYQWPRKSFLLTAMPNVDETFAATLYLPHEGQISFAKVDTEESLEIFIKNHFSDLFPNFQNLEKDFFTNPIGKLNLIECAPWYYKNKFLLLGDAAHGILPFFGQGMNCAFEDCSILNKKLDELQDDWEKVLPQFSEERKKDTDAIAQMSYDQYLEACQEFTLENFAMQNQIEKMLLQRYAADFMTKFQLITFSRQPYSYILKCCELQKELFKILLGVYKNSKQIDWNFLDNKVHEFREKIKN
jgi:kynurenine 3-monooxygenase